MTAAWSETSPRSPSSPLEGEVGPTRMRRTGRGACPGALAGATRTGPHPPPGPRLKAPRPDLPLMGGGRFLPYVDGKGLPRTDTPFRNHPRATAGRPYSHMVATS